MRDTSPETRIFRQTATQSRRTFDFGDVSADFPGFAFWTPGKSGHYPFTVCLKEAIIVLGCTLQPGGLALGAAGRRSKRAAEAFQRGISRRIIVTGGRSHFGMTEADGIARRLTELGVDPRYISIEKRARNTFENAKYVRQMLPATPPQVAIVTCDFHMARALRTFTARGFDVVGLACHGPRESDWKLLERRTRESASWLLQLCRQLLLR